ncbi:MAG TPA: hypothetical protein VL970_15700 [Candidatus Acidoferrales bacterium]|nr:hypothetical protein [Candidatus Acidoferrales bacterium]
MRYQRHTQPGARSQPRVGESDARCVRAALVNKMELNDAHGYAALCQKADEKWKRLGPAARKTMWTDVISAFPADNFAGLAGNAFPQFAREAVEDFGDFASASSGSVF